jgi:hypothetical protein
MKEACFLLSPWRFLWWDKAGTGSEQQQHTPKQKAKINDVINYQQQQQQYQ